MLEAFDALAAPNLTVMSRQDTCAGNFACPSGFAMIFGLFSPRIAI
jgi:hypothetical protein